MSRLATLPARAYRRYPDMSREQQGVPVPSAGQPGLARVGKYLMLELLGEGAFGKVRLAVDESSGKQYAMKIMAKSHIKANELTLQVRREIAVMKAMRHRKLTCRGPIPLRFLLRLVSRFTLRLPVC